MLLGRFLDMGPWAVDLALSVGIFPYVLKLLQTTSTDLRWARGCLTPVATAVTWGKWSFRVMVTQPWGVMVTQSLGVMVTQSWG